MSDKKNGWFMQNILGQMTEEDIKNYEAGIKKDEEALEKLHSGKTITLKSGEDISGKTPEEIEVVTKVKQLAQEDLEKIFDQWLIAEGKEPKEYHGRARLAEYSMWYNNTLPKLIKEGKIVFSSGELSPEENKKREESRKVQEDAMDKYDPGTGPAALRMLEANTKNAENHPKLYENSKIGD